MNHSHHEYLFDYRHKDLETGKLNLDKLNTLNSNTCLSDWIEPGREPSYEYCVRVENERYMSSVRKEQREDARKHHIQKEEDRIRLVASEKIRLEELEKEMQEREENRQKELVKLEEYRVRLLIREEQLIKERQKSLAERVGYSGQRIITSKWNVR